MTHVIVVINQKGGVAKTTTAINLGSSLAARNGQRVLLVDLDPQSNATMILTATAEEDPPVQGLFEVLTGDYRISDVVCPSHRVGLDICPSTIALAAAETRFSAAYQREGLLRRVLDPILPYYDYVLIDCPPSLGLLTHMALTMGTEVLIPLMPERLALKGMGDLFHTIREVQTLGNPQLRILGILITRYNKWPVVYRTMYEKLVEIYGDLLFEVQIPQAVVSEEATIAGFPVVDYDATSTVAQAYASLMDEVINRMGV